MLEVILLDEERESVVIGIIEVHLVVERSRRLVLERIGREEVVDKRKGRLNRVLDLRCSAVLKLDRDIYGSYDDAQLLALVKGHRVLTELPRREHVDNLADIGVGPLDELSDSVAFDFDSLSVRSRRHRVHEIEATRQRT